MPLLDRRQFLRATSLAGLGSALLSGCASPPWPGTPAQAPAGSAAQRLRDSALAHGLGALPALRDINVAFDGDWAMLINRIQPALVDEAFRKRSEERLMLGAGVMAQAHEGPSGRKQVLRRWGPGSSAATGAVGVWYGGQPSSADDLRQAAAVVADAYRIFLLGPMVLVDRALDVQWGAPAEVAGRPCDTLLLQLRPGLGLGAQPEGDQLALYIDRRQGLMRRVRFSLNGLAFVGGAVVEVEVGSHLSRHGIQWPTHFVERLVRPIPNLPVHDWRLTGLDVNRGYAVDELTGPALGPNAAKPAALLKA